MNDQLKQIKEMLNEKGIRMDTDYNKLTLLFSNGETLIIEAEGYEGTKLYMTAELKVVRKARVE